MQHCFNVHMASGHMRPVMADYFVIEQGALILRNMRKPGSYPQPVYIFARDTWVHVEVVQQTEAGK